jgi:hypothetical protein
MENESSPMLASEFRDIWERYLKNLKKVVCRKLETRHKRRRDRLSPLVENTFDLLLGQRALKEIESAAIKVNVEPLKLFQQELEIFNSSIEDDDYDLDEAMDDGEQAKGSAENIFNKLPKWLKDVLKVLNEILKMIRGA